MIFEIIDVSSYSGFRPDERPLSFSYAGKNHQVKMILESWYEGSPIAGNPSYKFFKVVTTGGMEFLLRYNVRFCSWALLIE
jgi:hypothetical protein